MALFSRRNTPTPDELTYEFSNKSRKRILHVLWTLNTSLGNPTDTTSILAEVGQRLWGEYGGLVSADHHGHRDDNPVLEHYANCSDEQVLDFLEAWFQCFHYDGGNRGVEAVNTILREDGIGYSFSPYVREVLERTTPRAALFGGPSNMRTEYPKAIRKDSEYTHSQILEPALRVLASPKFATANSEMLDALTRYRDGDFAAALTSCGAAFESVLKTICEEKKWPYVADKDTCGPLVETCREHKLFDPYYAPILVGVSTIRSKISTAHGKGPKPVYGPVEQEQVEHLINLASTHIVFLAKLSGL